MAKVTVVFEDSSDGVEVSFQFDPEVEDENSLTEAQALAVVTMQWMQSEHALTEEEDPVLPA